MRVEAEDFDLSGFKVASLRAADNGKIIVREGKGEHVAELEFSGNSGTYDILVDYFDESDGESELSLSVNGKIVDNWDWSDQNDSKNANQSTAATHVIEDIIIKTGDVVKLVGDDDGREPLRIDAVEFVPDELAFMA